jgi:hypothetical protein
MELGAGTLRRVPFPPQDEYLFVERSDHHPLSMAIAAEAGRSGSIPRVHACSLTPYSTGPGSGRSPDRLRRLRRLWIIGSAGIPIRKDFMGVSERGCLLHAKGVGMINHRAISRRQFLQTSGLAAAGTVLGSCILPGVVETAARSPSPDTAKPTAGPSAALQTVATSNPPVVDMRPIIRSLGLAVKNQTGSAPCAVHAFTFLLEYQYIRRIFSDLSETYLQYATFQLEKPAMTGGENFRALNIGYQKWGIVPQADVPNRGQLPAEISSAVLAAGQHGLRLTQEFIKEWDSSTGASPAQLDQAMAFLDQDVPVAAGLLWPKTFQTQVIDGIDVMVVPTAADKWNVVEDGHAVVLVGYGKGSQYPGNGYFIFRNSWGSWWGDQGYGYMPFDYLLKYANDLCVMDYP